MLPYTQTGHTHKKRPLPPDGNGAALVRFWLGFGAGLRLIQVDRLSDEKLSKTQNLKKRRLHGLYIYSDILV
jgi:hypothetical protein